MDCRREFTRQLLRKTGGADFDFTDALPEVRSFKVLAVADHTAPMPVPVVRETLSLRRFGVPVAVAADVRTAAKLRRHAGAFHILEELPEIGSAGSLCALVAAAGPTTLAETALGLGGGFTAGTILNALWHGVPVYADLSALRKDCNGKECQNPALLAVYEGYLDVLRKMGIRGVGRGEILPALLRDLGLKNEVNEVNKNIPPRSGKRIFITRLDVEKYVEKYGGPGRWSIPWNAVVTAEAIDTAAKRKIVLARQDRQEI